MKKGILLLLLFGVGVLSAPAQTKPAKKQPKKEKSTETDDYSEPEKTKSKTKSKSVKVYEPDDYDAPKAKKEGKIAERNLLKYNAFAIFNGCFPLLYERVLNPNWSVEGTVGLTYASIKAARRSFITNFSSSSGASANAEDDILWGYENLESKMGYMFGLAARYHFSKELNIPEGGYILGGFQSHTYKYDASAFTAPMSRGGGLVPTTTNLFDIVRLAVGFQAETTFFYWDYNIGVALRNTSFNGSYYENNAVFTGSHNFGTKVVLLGSVRMGIAF
jgi:hypothetical protein